MKAYVPLIKDYVPLIKDYVPLIKDYVPLHHKCINACVGGPYNIMSAPARCYVWCTARGRVRSPKSMQHIPVAELRMAAADPDLSSEPASCGGPGAGTSL